MNPGPCKIFVAVILLALMGGGFDTNAGALEAGKIARLEILAQGESVNKQVLHLHGGDARQQILVNARHDSGLISDCTRKVTFEVAPAELARIDKNGIAVPLQDGKGTLTARTSDGVTATIPIEVEESKTISAVNFPNQIVPIFTKNGCNGGGCHGKSSGQNGFKLSLLGFEPTEDYEHLVKEARGRRLFPAAPERSLLLLKGAAILPHGGGKHLDPKSDDYRLLIRWIAQGMPYGKTNDPTVARIEVSPGERTMQRNADQQLMVLAHYTDGTSRDVTRSALFEPNEKELAKTYEDGRVEVFERPGDVAVMVRYQGYASVFRATIPLGAPVDKVPASKTFIDDLVFKKLKTVGMPPSEICDDSTFLRRVTIDVAGRLPTPEETRAFLESKESNKRDKWIDQLLASTDYADNFANKWSSLLRNKRTEANQKHGTFAFYSWIRDSFAENKPYDQFVREIIAASGDLGNNPPVAWYRQVRDMNVQLEDTAQLFLGQRLQCAQCHHHPYEKWSQNDYYSFGAFFSTVARKGGEQPGEEVIYHKRSVASATNKKTKLPVKPAGLGAVPAALTPDDDPRLALADWLTAPQNNFFAKALVNRYWKHFFNRGLVEPEDDMRDTNPATNPELLSAVARDFASSGYDLKKLVRTICRSQVYQLSAVPNDYNKVDKQLYSRYYPKRLTAEVLYDAVNTVTKSESKFDGLPAGMKALQLPDNSFNANSYFLTVFGRPESSSACECERSMDASLAQSLHLLNSKEIQQKLANDKGRAAFLAADTSNSDDYKIREIYSWVYSREPEAREVAVAKKALERKPLVKDGKPDELQTKRQAYEDILWALLNTKEFLFNH
ncbi:MAG TPA: DUF1549 and DUF1553 domain-containing protein [Candidatus Saccharimonadales bacterium]|nr:DUF1549 and DUF1553 domain-containing protein [Candidatus Saccharimonadales bacterium]